MGKEILRKIEEDYYDYDGDEDDENVDDEEWEMRVASRYW